MPAGYTTVTGSNLTDATGAPITNATIFFQPCNNQGVPISFCVNGAGQATDTPVSAPVNAGAFTVELADTTKTQPANVAYLVTVLDNLSQRQLLGPGYLIQPSGTGWPFDTFVPSLGTLATLQAGPAGPAGSLPSLGPTLSRLPMGQNLFNAATATVGSAINANTGAVYSVSSGFAASDFIPANGGGSMATLNALFGAGTGGSGVGGYAFYDYQLNFLSGNVAGSSAGGTFAVPAGAYFLRVTLAAAAVATTMIVNGAVAPTAYAGYGAVDPATLASAVSAGQTTSIASGLAAMQHFVEGLFAGKLNLLNPLAATDNFLISATTGNMVAQTGYSASDYMPVTAGLSYALFSKVGGNPNFAGIAWYDAQYNFLSAVPLGAAIDPPSIAPAGASFARMSLYGTTTAPTQQMFVQDATLPTVYQPFTQIPIAGAAASVLSGKSFGAWGDSITAIFANQWQDVVIARTGMTLGFQDARPSRNYAQAFEFYGNVPGATLANGSITSFSIASNVLTLRGTFPALAAGVVVYLYDLEVGAYLNSASNAPVPITVNAGATTTILTAAFTHANVSPTNDTGMLVPPGRNQGYVASAPLGNTGTIGNTLAQDLADLDYMIVFLGTNDGGLTLGSPGDDATVASEYGYINRFATAILTANPSLRILFVTPYQSPARTTGIAAVAQAIQDVAAVFASPALDLYGTSGINALNAAVTLQSDQLHPSALGFSKFVGPAIAGAVLNSF